MVVSGRVSTSDLIAALKDFYNDKFTTKLMWDFSEADLSEISTDDLHMLISVSKSYSHLRKGGKTAFVLSGGYGFGLGRMFETLSVLNQHSVIYSVFKTKEEANTWLRS